MLSGWTGLGSFRTISSLRLLRNLERWTVEIPVKDQKGKNLVVVLAPENGLLGLLLFLLCKLLMQTKINSGCHSISTTTSKASERSKAKCPGHPLSLKDFHEKYFWVDTIRFVLLWDEHRPATERGAIFPAAFCGSWRFTCGCSRNPVWQHKSCAR